MWAIFYPGVVFHLKLSCVWLVHKPAYGNEAPSHVNNHEKELLHQNISGKCTQQFPSQCLNWHCIIVLSLWKSIKDLLSGQPKMGKQSFIF